jgi:hypothetical protein
MIPEAFKITYEALCIGPLTSDIFNKILQGDISEIETAFNKATEEHASKDGLTSYIKGVIKQGREQQLRIFKAEALSIACQYPATTKTISQ